MMLKEENYFYLIFITTLLLTRITVYVGVWYLQKYRHQKRPETKFFGFRIHHYMYGIVLMLISAPIKNLTLYAIGAALFIDELGYLLIRGKTHEDNYSKKSLIAVALFAILIFLFRKNLVFFGI